MIITDNQFRSWQVGSKPLAWERRKVREKKLLFCKLTCELFTMKLLFIAHDFLYHISTETMYGAWYHNAAVVSSDRLTVLRRRILICCRSFLPSYPPVFSLSFISVGVGLSLSLLFARPIILSPSRELDNGLGTTSKGSS